MVLVVLVGASGCHATRWMRVEGQVVDSAGHPVPDCEISMTWRPESAVPDASGEQRGRTIHVSEYGRFEFGVGKYEAEVWIPGLNWFPFRPFRRPLTPDGMEFAVSDRGVMHGFRVVQRDAEGLQVVTPGEENSPEGLHESGTCQEVADDGTAIRYECRLVVGSRGGATGVRVK